MLVPLLGYTTLLKNELPPGSTAVAYVSKLEDSAQKSERSVDQMLTAVRPQRQFNSVEGDLGALVSRAVANWKSNLPGDAAIEVTSEVEGCRSVFDEALMTRAIEELLSNARYGMVFGGKLTIRLRKVQAPPEFALSSTASEVVEIEVSDSGMGMTPDVFKRCCEPFFSTRPRGQASGLGLTAVQSIALLHGGIMGMGSAEGSGTSVHLWLPVGGNRQGNDPVAPVSSRTGNILYADPDQIGREVAKTFLTQVAEAVVLAKDQTEMIKLLDRNAARVSLAIISAGLSSGGVLDSLAAIRNRAPSLPLVWFGVQDEAAMLELLPERSIYLRKPFPLSALFNAIRGQLG